MNTLQGNSDDAQPSTKKSLLEVEQKYRVASHEPLLVRLHQLNAIEWSFEKQCDIYLQHPCRDFAVSGEAFRVRQINESAVVTYKGPRLAGPTKIRTEIEIPLAEKTDQEWLQMLLTLGFREVARVFKQRRSFRLLYESAWLTVALDDVSKLGTFVEIEAIVDDPAALPSIQSKILAAASELNIDQVEPRSYLRQLLEQPAI